MMQKNAETKRAVAKLSNLRVSPTKARLIADQIRNQMVSRATEILHYSHKDVAKDFAKLIDSAVANAENNLGMDVDELYVHEIYVDKGRVRKAMRARARGRRNIIRKRSSHVVVYLAEKAS